MHTIEGNKTYRLKIAKKSKVRSMNYTTCIVVSGNSGALACLKRHKAASFLLAKAHLANSYDFHLQYKPQNLFIAANK